MAKTVTSAPRQSSVFFRSDGLRLHARRHEGQGSRPVVVVPGVTTPAGGFASIAASIAELPEVSDVYVLDMRGRGLSERAGPGRHRAGDYAEDVLALIDELALAQPLLVGHSLGARVVACARAAVPGYSCGVVAIDPVLSGPGRRPYPTQLDHFLNELRGAREGHGIEHARERFPSWPDEQIAQRVKWLATCDEVAIVESFSWFHLEAFEPAWQAVLPPAVLLAGDESPAVTASDVSALAGLNPQASVIVAEHSGHMVPWDNLQRCLEVISQVLTPA
jgi:N-formylmaleamate deformylase